MALALQPTLAELSSELLNLIGQGGTGVADPATQARARAAIRRGQAIVIQECPWTINRKRVGIALAALATTFNWPDDTEPGFIHRVSAVRSTNLLYEWDLSPGIDSDDRTSWAYGGFSTLQDTPFKYDIHDDTWEVGPACSDAVTIYLLYDVGRSVLTDDGDRPNCDGEAVLLQAEMVLRNQLGGTYREAVPLCAANYQKYMDRIKAKQGVPQTFVPGSTWIAEDMSRRVNMNTQRHWAWRTRRP